MNSLKKPLRILLPVLAALQLAACSKTVQWEEEVPLNTGEVIWVKRSLTYVRSGASGNPFKLSWRLEERSLVLVWDGTKYKWTGDTDPMLLAIDAQRRPILVADAASGNLWGPRHDYKCVKPYYVQFVPKRPDEWVWPLSIEPWLYGKTPNLMDYTAAPDEMPTRVSQSLRQQLDAGRGSHYPPARQVLSDHVPDFCKGRV
jgi:hypothetical protein